MVATECVVFAVIGALVYVVPPMVFRPPSRFADLAGKLSELGRLVFFAAFLICMLAISGRTVRLV